MLGAGDARDVTLNVNLAGIRLLDPKTEVFLFFFPLFFFVSLWVVFNGRHSSSPLKIGIDEPV